MSPFGFGDIFTLLDLRRQRALRATSSSRSATSSRRTFPASSQPATKRSQTSTSRTTGLCALIEFTDKQLILTRPGPLQIQGSTKPTGKTLGGQGLPLKKRHHVHRAGSRVRLAGAQSASSHPRSQKAECATQKRVDVAKVAVPEPDSLLQPELLFCQAQPSTLPRAYVHYQAVSTCQAWTSSFHTLASRGLGHPASTSGYLATCARRPGMVPTPVRARPRDLHL
jgi:hypothetical protein